MGHAKRQKDRRAKARKARRTHDKMPNRWMVVGRDGYGEPFNDESRTQADAERVAAGVRRRGGTVHVVETYWHGGYAGYLPVGTDKSTAYEYIQALMEPPHDRD